MQAFMLYMSGSGVQIFSMGTVFMLLSNPIKGVVGIAKGNERPYPRPMVENRLYMILTSASPLTFPFDLPSAFEPFRLPPNSKEAPASLVPPMAVFVLCQCLTLALGLWKCNQMGILPTGSADFLAFETRGPVRTLRSLALVNPN